jgi:hypothetical protein
MIRCLQANVRVTTAQIEKSGPRYSRSAASSYSRSTLERPRQRRRSQGPLDPVAEEGRGKNEVMQLANPAANVAANAPADPTANAPQTPRQMILAMPLTTQSMLSTSRGTSPQIQDAMQELSLLRSKPIVRREVSVTA